MKEVEILVEVKSSIEEVRAGLACFSFVGEKRILDIYYIDPRKKDLKPNPSGRLNRAFRLRKKDRDALMTYKIDHFDDRGIWTFSDEYEIRVSDFETAEHIIANLGLKELVRIDNKKFIYETPGYEIVLEDVKDLGTFLEVELLTRVADNEIEGAKNRIRSFIRSLNIRIDAELNVGKPELMLRKIKPIRPISKPKKE